MGLLDDLEDLLGEGYDWIDDALGGWLPGGVDPRFGDVPSRLVGTGSVGDTPPPSGPPAASNGKAGTCNIYAQPQQKSVMRCPPGYVAVDMDNDGINDTCMMKEVAVACKKWKRRPKPLLTAADRTTLRKAQTVMNRVTDVVSRTNEIQGKARYVRQKRNSNGGK